LTYAFSTHSFADDGEPVQLFAQAGAIEEDFVSPEAEVTEDLEEKFYPEEIIGHSLLPNKRK
jgi:hypothetical protein